MKNLKIETEFQAIPAIGFVIGYDDFGGLVIMIPFVSVTIKRELQYNQRNVYLIIKIPESR